MAKNTAPPNEEAAPEQSAPEETVPDQSTPESSTPVDASTPVYIVYAGPGEGATFSDNGKRVLLVAGVPIEVGKFVTPEYAARLVEAEKAIYCDAPEAPVS